MTLLTILTILMAVQAGFIFYLSKSIYSQYKKSKKQTTKFYDKVNKENPKQINPFITIEQNTKNQEKLLIRLEQIKQSGIFEYNIDEFTALQDNNKTKTSVQAKKQA